MFARLSNSTLYAICWEIVFQLSSTLNDILQNYSVLNKLVHTVRSVMAGPLFDIVACFFLAVQNFEQYDECLLDWDIKWVQSVNISINVYFALCLLRDDEIHTMCSKWILISWSKAVINSQHCLLQSAALLKTWQTKAYKNVLWMLNYYQTSGPSCTSNKAYQLPNTIEQAPGENKEQEHQAVVVIRRLFKTCCQTVHHLSTTLTVSTFWLKPTIVLLLDMLFSWAFTKLCNTEYRQTLINIFE